MYAAETTMSEATLVNIGEQFWNERRMHHQIFHFNEVSCGLAFLKSSQINTVLQL